MTAMTEVARPEADQAIARIAAALEDKRLTINALDDGSGVVLDVEGEQMLMANGTGIAIVQAIAEGDRDVASVARRLAGQFDVGEGRAREDVTTFVAQVAGSL
ncbi:PqqD family protein [Wenzhouxiangella sp. EGI_FJ10305]|uniref:PqqD family protein n=1 Tax=Wenzhouxiangella sp. EGI_FJ10305 TaxID=3243768 RepID=UPI0035E25D90